MRKRVGTKLYDTDTAILVDTTPDGIQVYRKKNSPQFFLYNPKGKNGPEMFFELPPEQIDKYLTSGPAETKVHGSTKMVQFSPADVERFKRLAYKCGMSVRQFILMLVDEYENKDRR